MRLQYGTTLMALLCPVTIFAMFEASHQLGYKSNALEALALLVLIVAALCPFAHIIISTVLQFKKPSIVQRLANLTTTIVVVLATGIGYIISHAFV